MTDPSALLTSAPPGTPFSSVVTATSSAPATRTSRPVLAPVVLVLCVVGAYALNNTMQSVYVLLLFGVVGYTLVKLGFPLAPLILGLILGDRRA